MKKNSNECLDYDVHKEEIDKLSSKQQENRKKLSKIKSDKEIIDNISFKMKMLFEEMSNSSESHIIDNKLLYQFENELYEAQKITNEKYQNIENDLNYEYKLLKDKEDEYDHQYTKSSSK